MRSLKVLFAICVLAMSVVSFAQQSSTDKTDASQKSQAKKDSSSAEAKTKTNADAKPARSNGMRSVMDRPLDERPDNIVVPAGTEIRVDLVDGKVVVPVRVGFSTPIPALSKASVKIDRIYAPAAYDANGNLLNNNSRYAEYGALTGVTVNGVTYKVESDSVPLATPGSSAVSPNNSMGNSPHDVKFTLSAPVEITR